MLWASSCGLAFAGPPYETDDPEPTQFRNYEIYFFQDYHRVGESIDASIGTLEINFGGFHNTQLSASIPVSTAQQGTKTDYGLGDIELAVKYRFLPETNGRPQVSFYPAVTIASGNPNTGLGAGHATLFLPLWAQKSYGPWTIFGGGGLQVDGHEANQHEWREGLAVTRDIGKATNLGVEVYRATPDEATSPGYTDIGIGIIQGVGKYHAVLARFGRALAPGSVHAYAAYEWKLGPAGASEEP